MILMIDIDIDKRKVYSIDMTNHMIYFVSAKHAIACHYIACYSYVVA